jgi:hypothetical protein
MKTLLLLGVLCTLIACNRNDSASTSPGSKDTVYVYSQFRHKIVFHDEDVLSLNLEEAMREHLPGFTLTEEGRKYLGVYKTHGLESDTTFPFVYYKAVRDSAQFSGYKMFNGKRMVCGDSIHQATLDAVLYEYDMEDILHRRCGPGFMREDENLLPHPYSYQIHISYFPGYGFSFFDTGAFDFLGEVTLLYN